MRPVVDDQADLGVGADVHHQRRAVLPPHAARVASSAVTWSPPTKPPTLGARCTAGAGAPLAGRARAPARRGLAHRRDEGRAAELAHRPAGQQVLHGGVAADRDVDDVARLLRRRRGQVVGQRIDRVDGGRAQLLGGASAPDRVVDAADQIGAPGDLRVLQAQAGQALARCPGRPGRPAALVVPRSTARPSSGAPGAAKPISSSAAGRRAGARRRASRVSRSSAGQLGARPRASTRQPAAPAARGARGRRRWPGVLQAWRRATCTSKACTAGCSGSASPSPPVRTSARTTGGQRARRDLEREVAARLHPAGAQPLSCALPVAASRCTRAFAMTRTTQLPQVPRPPQAPTMRTPARRARGNRVSSSRHAMSAVERAGSAGGG